MRCHRLSGLGFLWGKKYTNSLRNYKKWQFVRFAFFSASCSIVCLTRASNVWIRYISSFKMMAYKKLHEFFNWLGKWQATASMHQMGRAPAKSGRDGQQQWLTVFWLSALPHFWWISRFFSIECRGLENWVAAAAYDGSGWQGARKFVEPDHTQLRLIKTPLEPRFVLHRL